MKGSKKQADYDQSVMSPKGLYDLELERACQDIAKLRYPRRQLHKLLTKDNPDAISYETIRNVFNGTSENPLVLNYLTELGIKHNRVPDDGRRKQSVYDRLAG